MICANPKCGKEFEPKDRRQKYCTRKCMHLYCRDKYNANNIKKVRACRLRWNKQNPTRCTEAQIRFYNKHRTKILGKLKRKRLEDPGLHNLRGYLWRAMNPDKTRQIHRNAWRKGKDELADWYIRTLLTEHGRNPREDINNADLIEVKRIHIELYRELKQQKHGSQRTTQRNR